MSIFELVESEFSIVKNEITNGIIVPLEHDIEFLVDKLEDFLSYLLSVIIRSADSVEYNLRDLQTFVSEHSIRFIQLMSSRDAMDKLFHSVSDPLRDRLFDIFHMFIDRISDSLRLLSETINPDGGITDIMDTIAAFLSPVTSYIESIGKNLYERIPHNMTELRGLINNLNLVSSADMYFILITILDDTDAIISIIDKLKKVKDVKFLSSLFQYLGFFSILQAILLQVPVFSNVIEGVTLITVLVSFVISLYKSGRTRLRYYVNLIFGNPPDDVSKNIIRLIERHHKAVLTKVKPRKKDKKNKPELVIVGYPGGSMAPRISESEWVVVSPIPGTPEPERVVEPPVEPPVELPVPRIPKLKLVIAESPTPKPKPKRMTLRILKPRLVVSGLTEGVDTNQPDS